MLVEIRRTEMGYFVFKGLIWTPIQDPSGLLREGAITPAGTYTIIRPSDVPYRLTIGDGVSVSVQEFDSVHEAKEFAERDFLTKMSPYFRPVHTQESD